MMIMLQDIPYVLKTGRTRYSSTACILRVVEECARTNLCAPARALSYPFPTMPPYANVMHPLHTVGYPPQLLGLI